MTETRFTPSGVRLRRHSSRPGDLNWLLLPGGPGIGSESLQELADAIDVPGAVWLVDLPGDGSNLAPPGAPANVFEAWPHAAWHARFVEMTQRCPLPEVDAAAAAYEADRRDANIAAITVSSAPWNFAPAGLEAGRALLGRMPYNGAAIDWSEAEFDHVYAARWWPKDMPVLRLAGDDDRIVWQGGWDTARYQTPNVIDRAIAGGGHFPWIENPMAVRAAFAEFAERLAER